MTLNLIVPVGAVRVVIVDERVDSTNMWSISRSYILSPETYQRLTVPPMLWVGFQGSCRIHEYDAQCGEY